jgi:LPS-assembly lipoprotein
VTAPAASRRWAIGAVILALAGCGFEPLYGERSRVVDPELAAVRVEPIPERVGQLLAVSLRDSFNPDGQRVDTKYRLTVTLNVIRREIGIRLDATASRLQLEMSAAWILSDTAGRALASGTSRSATSFDITDDQYANLVAEQDGRARMVRDVSDELRTRVRTYLARREAA